MGAKLYILDGPQKGESFLLEDDKEIIIGRSKESDIVISDNSVSRNHCRFIYQQQQAYVIDLESANGVWIGGKKVLSGVSISLNDIVQIGNINVQLQPVSGEKTTELYLESDETQQIVRPNIVYRKEAKEASFDSDISKVRMRKNLKLLHEIGKLLQLQTTIERLSLALLKKLLKRWQAERGCLILELPDSDPKMIYCTQEGEDTFNGTRFLIHRSIVNATMAKGNGTISVEGKPAHRSILCVLIEGHKEVLGVIYLNITEDRAFTKEDLELLTAIGRQAGLGIERILLEEKLKHSEQEYRSIYQSIIENSKDVMYRRNLDGSFAMVSPSIEKLIGVTCEQLQENPEIWEGIIDEGYKEQVLQQRSRSFMGHESNIEYKIVKNEEKIWIEEACYPVRDKKGRIFCIQGLLKNITERKRLEEQAVRGQKMEALGRLAGGVAHDLNNILGGLVGYPDLILMQLPKDFPASKLIGKIKDSALRAADVVQDLLTLARRERYSMGDLNLNQVVKDYLDSLEFEDLNKRHRNFSIVTKLSDNPLLIRGSHPHLTKVIMNLVMNAVEAISEGGLIEVSTDWLYIDNTTVDYNKVKQGEYTILKIKDNGSGIAESDIHKIFEPFF